MKHHLKDIKRYVHAHMTECMYTSYYKFNLIIYTQGLILENKKANPNRLVVTELMEQTFAFRRKKVLEEPCTSNSVASMCEEYPFLHSLDQVAICMRNCVFHA